MPITFPALTRGIDTVMKVVTEKVKSDSFPDIDG